MYFFTNARYFDDVGVADRRRIGGCFSQRAVITPFDRSTPAGISVRADRRGDAGQDMTSAASRDRNLADALRREFRGT